MTIPDVIEGKCPAELALDVDVVRPALERFISRHVQGAGLKGVVFGLSGGVDSAVVAGLAANALGPAHVHAFWLPYHTSADREDAQAVAASFGVTLTELSIAPLVDAYLKEAGPVNDLRRGNICARARMLALFDQSVPRKATVLGTGNKTELLLGYFTLFGDGASGLAPLADLYKGQVYILAAALGVPPAVIAKTPTADLWPGQTDEGEMGFRYYDVDRYLYFLVDRGEPPEDLLKKGFDAAFQRRVVGMINKNFFKRKVPIPATVTGKTLTKPISLPEWF